MQHMEQACYLLRKGVTERAGDIAGRVVVVDTYFGRYLQTEWGKYKSDADSYQADEKLLAYFDGRSPATIGRAWEGAELILLPLNVDSVHWIAVAIDLVGWQVRVYDSDVYIVRDRHLPAHLSCITHLIPVLMNAHPALMATYVDKLPKPFALSREKRIPQNKQR